jgi:hypothetical protein
VLSGPEKEGEKLVLQSLHRLGGENGHCELVRVEANILVLLPSLGGVLGITAAAGHPIYRLMLLLDLRDVVRLEEILQDQSI